MSMATFVVGFRPADERWRQMEKIWDACKAANIEPPCEVLDFFNGETPTDAGMVVEIVGTPAVREWKDDDRMAEGFEVDVRELPQEVHIIRFYNSW